MKRLSFVLILIVYLFPLDAQITWSDDIAEIVYANCTACHRDAGIGPFPLVDFEEDVAPNVNAILDAVGTGYMPPWIADTTYQEYIKERVLSSQEIQLIVDWVANGSPQGNPADAPPPPVYQDQGFITATPDLEIQIPDYVSNASQWFDDYVCFSVPTGLTSDKKLKAWEVIPGNTEIVHHALIYIDEDATYPTNTSGLCGGPTEGLIGGYTPGGVPTIYPSNGDDLNLGVTLPAGSNIVFAMHYPNGSAGSLDSTKLRMYFYDDAVSIREVSSDPVIQNWDFTIEAFATEEVNAQFGFIPIDISLVSVFPHMHLLGNYIESHAITLDQDTIPLVRIPHWDFEWQEFYFFKNMVKIPAWSTIYGTGIYENTPGNPHNPNDPPIDVSAGLNTSDEMFLIYYSYLPYQAGDEFVDLEELSQLPTGFYENEFRGDIGIEIYPNPVTEELFMNIDLSKDSKVSMYIYDVRGTLIDIVADRITLSQGSHQITWRPGDDISPGTYFYSVNMNGKFGSGKILYSPVD